MILFEFKKIFTKKTLILLAVIILAQAAVMFIPKNYERNFSPIIYKRLISELSGDFSEEKYNAVKARCDEINEIISSDDAITAAYHNGEISAEEYYKHSYDRTKALNEKDTAEYLLEKSDYFKKIGGGVYFYDVDCGDFLADNGFNFFAAFAVIFITIPIFCAEYRSNARSMLFSSVNGTHKLCGCKIIVAAVCAFFISMLIFMVRYCCFCGIYGNFGGYLVRNIMDYSAFGNLSIFGYYFFNSVIKSAGLAVGAVFICAVSCITGNTLFTAFFVVFAIVFPAFFNVNSQFFSYAFLGYAIENGYFAGANIALIFGIMLVKIVIYSLICNYAWKK